MLNILTEPLIRMDTTAGRREASLPEVYAALAADEVVAFPALRPHQRHAWHAFLVQLGAMAMHRAGLTELPDDAGEWRRIIQGLTPDWPDDEPWQLVVDDFTKPAFMQPPARTSDEAKGYSSSATMPDELDMLVTAKNHDLKSALNVDAGVDDWLFALITVQTMDGDPGRNPGISRMNGAFGNRPAFSITFSVTPGAHAKRDIIALLGLRPSVLANYSAYKPIGGEVLLWVPAWNGTPADALQISDLDPYYIEICRRWRLVVTNGAITEARKGKVVARGHRVAAQMLNGVTGDPWTPIDRRDKKGDKALTLPGGGFTYKRVVDYLDASKFTLPPLAGPTPDEQRTPDMMQLVARAMVRGQGKTEGYYERIIPLRHKARGALMGRGNAADDLGAMAQGRIEQIGVEQRILSHAIQVYAARGDRGNTSAEHRRLASPWLNRLDEIVDDRFFDDLQVEFEEDDRAERERARKEWLRDFVIHRARGILQDAADALPCPAMFRYQARVNAEGLFEGRVRTDRGLPGELFPERAGGDDDDD